MIEPMEINTKNLMVQLAGMNVVLILLDVAILVTASLNLYMIQTTFKSLVYSFKLKIEFGVLSRIVRIVQDRSEPNSLTWVTSKLGTIVGTEKLESGAQVTQENIPSEWRMSGVLEVSCNSDLIEEYRRRGRDGIAHSLKSEDITYPGRLS